MVRLLRRLLRADPPRHATTQTAARPEQVRLGRTGHHRSHPGVGGENRGAADHLHVDAGHQNASRKRPCRPAVRHMEQRHTRRRLHPETEPLPTVTAAVIVLVILLGGSICLLLWQQIELNAARYDLREMERQRDGYRDDLWRRDRLGVKPKERAEDADW